MSYQRISKKIFSKRNISEIAYKLICHLILFGVAFTIVLPLAKKGLTMFKGVDDLLDPLTAYIPRKPTTDTIRLTVTAMQYWSSLFNTMLLSLGVALLTTASCTVIAYGFARFKFRGRGILFFFVLLALLIPPHILMNSYYMKFRYFDILGIIQLFFGSSVNLLDSFTPFVLLSVTGLGMKNSLFIFLQRQYFKGLPLEIEEAGYIDGAGTFSIFTRIMLPNAAPILVTVFLFSFSWQWSDNYFTVLFLNNFKVLPDALASLQNYKLSELEPILRTAMIDTGIIFTIVPLVLIYFIGQRFFIQGISRSGLVG